MKQLLIFFLLISLFYFSCSDPEKIETTPSNKIEVLDGWARPGKAGMMSAAYFTLNNRTNSADTLTSISSNVTSNTQIHRSYQTEDGLMGMEEQPFVAISSNSAVEFKQGGLHVMIIQPETDLVEGDSVSLSLNFSSSKVLNVKIPIRLNN